MPSHSISAHADRIQEVEIGYHMYKSQEKFDVKYESYWN